MRRLIMSAIGAGALVGGLVSASPAAMAQSKGGAFQVWALVNPNSSNARILLTGAIADYGSGRAVNASGKTDSNGNYELLMLRKGTILVNSTQFNQAQNNAQPTFNSTTCSGSFHASGSVQLVRGSGAYRGISGSVTLTGQGGIIVRRTSKGTCNQNQNAQPAASLIVLTGSGNATLPG